MLTGLVVVLVGVLWLATNYGLMDKEVWDWLLPVLALAFGFKMIAAGYAMEGKGMGMCCPCPEEGEKTPEPAPWKPRTVPVKTVKSRKPRSRPTGPRPPFAV